MPHREHCIIAFSFKHRTVIFLHLEYSLIFFFLFSNLKDFIHILKIYFNNFIFQLLQIKLSLPLLKHMYFIFLDIICRNSYNWKHMYKARQSLFNMFPCKWRHTLIVIGIHRHRYVNQQLISTGSFWFIHEFMAHYEKAYWCNCFLFAEFSRFVDNLLLYAYNLTITII